MLCSQAGLERKGGDGQVDRKQPAFTGRLLLGRAHLRPPFCESPGCRLTCPTIVIADSGQRTEVTSWRGVLGATRLFGQCRPRPGLSA